MHGTVAIVGLGRVGLPLALTFADRGLHVIGVEKVQERIDTLNGGVMPFEETGTQELLERVLPTRRLELTTDVREAARADWMVLTLGTPALSHIEIDITDIRMVVDDLIPHLRDGQTLILRSTVGPGTTEWLAGYVEQRRGFDVGNDFFVAHVPERIAVNQFLEEIYSLPCIIGCIDPHSGDRAAELFQVFGTEIVQT